MELLLDLLLLLLLLLLLYVFNHVLIRGREAPPYNYVVNTYSRSSSRSSSSRSSSSSIWIRPGGNIFYFANQGGIFFIFLGPIFERTIFEFMNDDDDNTTTNGSKALMRSTYTFSLLRE